MQDGDDSNAQADVVHLQQRRVRARSGSVDRQAVEIESEIRQMQGKVLHLHPGVQRIAGLLLRRSQDVVVE